MRIHKRHFNYFFCTVHKDRVELLEYIVHLALLQQAYPLPGMNEANMDWLRGLTTRLHLSRISLIGRPASGEVKNLFHSQPSLFPLYMNCQATPQYFFVTGGI